MQVNILELSKISDQVCPVEIASIISRGVKINGFHTRIRNRTAALIANKSNQCSNIPKTIKEIQTKQKDQRRAPVDKFTVFILG